MDVRLTRARDIMSRFAERTGVVSGAPRRYLWTDAFAVCNCLGLARATGEGGHLELALRLVDRVHHVLGRHRPDDPRQGWISGLDDATGETHPTRGGLRIGKPLPERRPGEPPDERQEWDRDGQYFHYLTKWMQALDQTARALGQPLLNVWARELAVAAHHGFTHVPPGGGRMRMYWKVGIDLSRPLVASMGAHDPLDGFLSCVQLDATADAMHAPGPRLAEATADFADMIERGMLATADPLGVGGLLSDAYRARQLASQGALARNDALVTTLLETGLAGLAAWAERPDRRLPAEHRLAFRELGLAIGLAAVGLLERHGALDPPGIDIAALLARFAPYRALRDEIESFWLRPEHQQAHSWRAHEDINEVMLATCLVPEGMLVLQPIA